MNKWFILTIAVLISSPAIALGSVIQVPKDHNTIQGAIDAAVDGDIIEVKKGVYAGIGNKNLDLGGKAITLQCTSDNQECVIDSEGEGRGFYFSNGEGENTVISGFTVTNGNELWGGGIYCISSSPKIINCNINSNTAESRGGGMYVEKSNPTLINVTFERNRAPFGSGGGIYNNLNSSPTLSNVVFELNYARFSGGGMYNVNHSNPILTDVTFKNNSASDYGGGVVNWNYSSPRLTNVLFIENKAAYGGGMGNYDHSSPYLYKVMFQSGSAANPYYSSYGAGIYNILSDPTLVNVYFVNNIATKGGGVYTDRSSPKFTNVVFLLNSASSGGGMYSIDSWPTITNATFWGNVASEDGGGIRKAIQYPGYDNNLTIRNSIFWDNIAGDCGNQICGYYAEESISHSIYQGGAKGSNNIDLDPNFVDITTGDFRLQYNSPAINAGDNNALPEDNMDENQNGDTSEKFPFDLGGGPRVVNTVVDIGAYEFRNILKGDINGDNVIDLIDLILALRVLSGEETEENVYKYEDVNGDDKIGSEESVYILQKIADLR